MNPQTVAAAQRALSEAQAAHVAAAEKAVTIQTRIADAKLRQSQISAARINGTSSPAEAAEYSALAGDVALLETMLAEARTTTAALLAAQHFAADHLRMIQGEFDVELAQVAFDALTDKANRLEAALVDCVKELHQQGQRLNRGPSLVMSWRPTTVLASFCRGSSL
jgi:hypothetical protein